MKHIRSTFYEEYFISSQSWRGEVDGAIVPFCRRAPDIRGSCSAFFDFSFFSSTSRRNSYRAGTEPIPNQSSRALIIQRTCRGSSSFVSTPSCQNKHVCALIKLICSMFKVYKIWTYSNVAQEMYKRVINSPHGDKWLFDGSMWFEPIISPFEPQFGPF